MCSSAIIALIISQVHRYITIRFRFKKLSSIYWCNSNSPNIFFKLINSHIPLQINIWNINSVSSLLYCCCCATKSCGPLSSVSLYLGGCTSTVSISPNALASTGFMNLSRSMTDSIRSIPCRVCFTYR